MTPTRATILLMLLLTSTPDAAAQSARYRLTVVNTWSEETHPGHFPFNAHFSWFGGGTHDDTVSFWAEGQFATNGVKEMAESGVTLTMEFEVAQAIAAGSAASVLGWHEWFCPDGTPNSQCGSLVREFDVQQSHPLVTLATMLGPSPDWFVGVSSLALHDGNDWIDETVVDLRPYDAGTRSNNIFELWGPLTTPPQPVSRITAVSGQLIGPDSLGSFSFTRIGQIFDLGQAVAGDFAPTLGFQGSLLPDETVTLGAVDLPPGMAAWMFFGVQELNQPFAGGVLVPDPVLTVVLPTGTGTLLMSGPMPSNIPSGAEILIQVWTPDAGGPAGASATNALKLVVP